MAPPAAAPSGAAETWPAKLSMVALSLAAIVTDGAVIVVSAVVLLPTCAVMVFETILADAEPAPANELRATLTPTAKPWMLSLSWAVTSTVHGPLHRAASVVTEESLIVALRVSLIAL